MSDDVEEVKRRINLVDFVSSYLPLRKSGAGWKGVCPFHQEKTPSFHVNPDRQIFKCFGCQAGGDVLEFVMKMEHLTFPEALGLLADRVGVILDRRKTPDQYAKEKDEKSRLYALNRMSAEVFHRILLHPARGKAARDILASRGLTEATITDFQLGFAPPTPRSVPTVLEQFLVKRGFTAEERRRAGSPERFRHRLIFPLWDALGNVVGFTGRAVDPDDQPKYLNTPETPLFKKSRLLYPLHRARDAIKTTERAILVEGQMDVLLAHQLGTREAVATSGTALSVDHLEILARYTPKILLAFDSDAAGIEATRKAALLAYELELEPSVITLSAPHKDLGELALAEPNRWPAAIAAARLAFAWQLDRAIEAAAALEAAARKKAIARQTLPFLGAMRDPIERTHWLQALARAIQAPERVIADALERMTPKKSGVRSQESAVVAVPATRERAAAEEVLIGLLVAFPEHLAAVLPRLDLNLFPAGSRAARLAKTLSSWYAKAKAETVKDGLAALANQFERSDYAFLAGLVAELDARHADTEAAAVRAEIEASLAHLRSRQRDVVKETMAAKIAAAEAGGDRGEVQKLLKELQQMLKDRKA